MTNFSEMTDNELDAWIARELGWRVVFEKPTPKHAYAKWITYNPDGKRVGVAAPKGADPEYLILVHAPRHTRSVDAAVSLFAGHLSWDMRRRGYSYWTVIVYDKKGEKQIYLPCKDLARGVCEAWCLMKEAENANS